MVDYPPDIICQIEKYRIWMDWLNMGMSRFNYRMKILHVFVYFKT